GSLFRPRITLSGNLAAFHFVVLSSHDAAIVGRVAPLGQGERHFLSPIPVKNCRRDEQSHLKLPLSIHLRALSHPCHTRVAGPPAAGFIVSPDSPKASLFTRSRDSASPISERTVDSDLSWNLGSQPKGELECSGDLCFAPACSPSCSRPSRWPHRRR